MLPKTHIILGAVLSLLIYLIFPEIGFLATAIIFLSSVLIDVDHYLYYAIKTNNWSLKDAYRGFLKNTDSFRKLSKQEREEYSTAVIIFHGVECLIVLIILVQFYSIFIWVLLGFFIHLILDFIDMFRNKDSFYTKSSQLVVLYKNKSKKKITHYT